MTSREEQLMDKLDKLSRWWLCVVANDKAEGKERRPLVRRGMARRCGSVTAMIKKPSASMDAPLLFS